MFLACSGPLYHYSIATNIAVSHGQAFVAFGIAICSYSLSKKRRLNNPMFLLMLLPIIFHPAWTIPATHGDCGHMKRDVSYAITGIFAALLLSQMIGMIRREGFSIYSQKKLPATTSTSRNGKSPSIP